MADSSTPSSSLSVAFSSSGGYGTTSITGAAPVPTISKQNRLTLSSVVWIILHLVGLVASILHWCDTKAWGIDRLELALACFGLLPIAGLIGDLTEAIEGKTNKYVAGLSNSALGNATELLCGLAAIYNGEYEFLIATMVGSIVSNVLLVVGMSIMAWAWKNKGSGYDPNLRQIHVSGALALILSAGFYIICSYMATLLGESSKQRGLDLTGCGVLLVNFVVNNVTAYRTSKADDAPPVAVRSRSLIRQYTSRILAQQRTYRNLKLVEEGGKNQGGGKAEDAGDEDDEEDEEDMTWPQIAVRLIYATIIAGILSEAITSRLDALGSGLTPRFTGAVLVAILGNACEHSSAIKSAWKGSLDTAVQIAMSSCNQIAMFLIPLFVFVSLLKEKFLFLSFPFLDLLALTLAPLVACLVLAGSPPNMYLGFLLCSLYVVIAAAYYVCP